MKENKTKSTTAKPNAVTVKPNIPQVKKHVEPVVSPVNIKKRGVNKILAALLRKRIAALKTAGIQKSAIARKMKMSDKVFSTRTSIGNWSDSEVVLLDGFLNQYNIN